MTTVKNPSTLTHPLPSLSPVHNSSPIQSTFPTIQPISPNSFSTAIAEKSQSKKRVRFALKLETVQEDTSSLNDHKPVIGATKSNKRIIDPWREGGPLYGAYVEYLDKHGALAAAHASETHRTIRPTRSPTSPHKFESESITQTNVGLGRNKSPEVITASTDSATSLVGLPRIMQRPTITKKNKNYNNNMNNHHHHYNNINANNNNSSINGRRPSLPSLDPSLKQRVQSTNPSHNIQSKKIPSSISNKKTSPPIHPILKRTDTILPSIKDPKSNEKLIRIDNSSGTKVMNEYCQPQKLTEINPNSLIDANNEMHNLSEHCILPNISKTPQSPSDNLVNNQPYLLQNNNLDLLQTVIQ